MAELIDPTQHRFKPGLEGPVLEHSVEGIRRSLEAKAKEGQISTAILAQGFKSQFWAQLKVELEGRKKIATEKLIQTKPTADALYEISQIQAEIKALGVLLNLEKATEIKVSTQIKLPEQA